MLFPSAIRVARRYEGQENLTEQSRRLEAAIGAFGDAVRSASRSLEGWQKREPEEGREGLIQKLQATGKALYDMLSIEVEDPYTEARIKKYLRRVANLRKMVGQLMRVQSWEELDEVMASMGSKSKSVWNKWYEYSNEVVGLIRTFDVEVEGTFDVGGFHLVLYRMGLAEWSPETIDRLKWVMGEAAQLLKKRGLGALVYGNVFVFPGARIPGTSGGMAWYRRSDDVMTVAAGSSLFIKKTPRRVLQTVIHELGHRAYYRLMGTRSRASWEEFFELMSGSPPNLDTMIRRWEHFVSQADDEKEARRRRHFDLYYTGLKKHHPEEAEWLLIVVQSLGLRNEERYDSYHGFPTKSSKGALDQLLARKGEVSVFLEPVTAYSATNPSELFAEVFAHYILYGPRTISGVVRSAFLKALPMLKSGGWDRKKKPTREEQTLISAWRWGHITRQQLEAKLGKARADEIAPIQR
jgi:hypothetical protein